MPLPSERIAALYLIAVACALVLLVLVWSIADIGAQAWPLYVPVVTLAGVLVLIIRTIVYVHDNPNPP